MPLPSPIVRPIWKIELQFQQGVLGWNETYWYAYTSNLGESEAARKAAISLVFTRQAGLAYGTPASRSDAAYVSKWTATRVKGLPDVPFVQRAMNEYVSLTAGTQGYAQVPMGPTIGILCRSIDVSGFKKVNRIFRGGPEAWNILDPSGQPWRENGDLNNWIKGFGNWLSDPKDADGIELGVFCIRSRSKNDTTTHKHTVRSVSADANTGSLTYRLDGVFTYLPGTQVLIRDVRGLCAKRLNGVARVLFVTPGVGYTDILTDKHWCCGGQPQVNPGGSMRDLDWQYFACRNTATGTFPRGLSLIRGATRDTGGYSGVTRGASRKKCCG